jgi:hypothetical protein
VSDLRSNPDVTRSYQDVMRSCPAWLILERRHEQDGTRAGLQSQDKVVRHAGRLGLAALVQVCLESAGLPAVSATAHGHRLELEFPSAAETNANSSTERTMGSSRRFRRPLASRRADPILWWSTSRWSFQPSSIPSSTLSAKAIGLTILETSLSRADGKLLDINVHQVS